MSYQGSVLLSLLLWCSSLIKVGSRQPVAGEPSKRQEKAFHQGSSTPWEPGLLSQYSTIVLSKGKAYSLFTLLLRW